jgi:hypothetical protein
MASVAGLKKGRKAAKILAMSREFDKLSAI